MIYASYKTHNNKECKLAAEWLEIKADPNHPEYADFQYTRTGSPQDHWFALAGYSEGMEARWTLGSGERIEATAILGGDGDFTFYASRRHPSDKQHYIREKFYLRSSRLKDGMESLIEAVRQMRGNEGQTCKPIQKSKAEDVRSSLVNSKPLLKDTESFLSNASPLVPAVPGQWDEENTLSEFRAFKGSLLIRYAHDYARASVSGETDKRDKASGEIIKTCNERDALSEFNRQLASQRKQGVSFLEVPDALRTAVIDAIVQWEAMDKQAKKDALNPDLTPEARIERAKRQIAHQEMIEQHRRKAESRAKKQGAKTVRQQGDLDKVTRDPERLRETPLQKAVNHQLRSAGVIRIETGSR